MKNNKHFISTKKLIIALLTVFLIMFVTVGCALTGSKEQKNKWAVPTWSQTLAADNVESMSVSVLRDGGQAITTPVPQETQEDLIAIINSIPETDFKHSLGNLGCELTVEEWLKWAEFGETIPGGGTIRFSICRNDNEHHGVLTYQEGQVYLSVLVEHSELDGNPFLCSERWIVDNAALVEFLAAALDLNWTSESEGDVALNIEELDLLYKDDLIGLYAAGDEPSDVVLQYDKYVQKLDEFSYNYFRPGCTTWEADADGDGIKELYIIHERGSGTGVAIDLLTVCEPNGDKLDVWYHDITDIQTEFNENRIAVYDAENQTVTITYGGQTYIVELGADDWYVKTMPLVSELAYINGHQVYYEPVSGDDVLLTFALSVSGDGVPPLHYLPDEANVSYLLRFTGNGFEVTRKLGFKTTQVALLLFADLPRDLVTEVGYPSDPSEYYLVASLPEQDIRLYVRQHGEEGLLVWGSSYWELCRRFHTGQLNLPKLAMLDETHLAVISMVETGTGFGVEELVVYELAEGNHDQVLKEYTYDWQAVAESFNQGNQLTYNRDSNELTLTYNGKTYTSGTLRYELESYLGISSRFKGAAIANGHLVGYQINQNGTITVSLSTTIASGAEGEFTDEGLWDSRAKQYFPMATGINGFDPTWDIRFTGSGFELIGDSLYFPNASGPSNFSGYETRAEYPGLYFRTATDPISGITWQTAYTFVDGETALIAKYAPYPENLFVGSDGVEIDYDADPIAAAAFWIQALVDATMEQNPYWVRFLPSERLCAYENGFTYLAAVEGITLYTHPEEYAVTMIRYGDHLQAIPIRAYGFHGDSPDLLWQDLDEDGEKELMIICNGANTGTHQNIDTLTVCEWDGSRWTAYEHDLTYAIFRTVENISFKAVGSTLEVKVYGITETFDISYARSRWAEWYPDGYELCVEPTYVYQYRIEDGTLLLDIRCSAMPGAGNLAMCDDLFDFTYQVTYGGDGVITERPMGFKMK